MGLVDMDWENEAVEIKLELKRKYQKHEVNEAAVAENLSILGHSVHVVIEKRSVAGS